MKHIHTLFKKTLDLTIVLSFIFILFAFATPTMKSQIVEVSQEKILISTMAAPWGFTFINSDEVLFTEKQGKMYRYAISTNTLNEISGLPAIVQKDQGGLLDIAIHPNFEQNKYVYITYAVSATGGQTTALGRGVLVGNQLQNFTELFRALPIRNSGSHFGSRIVFDKNNMIYMSVGDRGSQNEAQNKNNHLGKVLRFNDDGTVPASNPLVGVPNTKPEIFCWGNRNIQGMAMHPETGEIYAHEHGPRGGDELNLIKPNTNYGWPAVTFGINYDGSQITPDTTLPGMQLPLTYWVPSIAPSGMTFIRNGQPNNEADILIGALAGTHIHWLKMKDNQKISSSRSMNGYARFRDIRQAPDGKIYAMTESPNRFVQLRISGLQERRPRIVLTQQSIDFGCIDKGATDTKTIQGLIKNEGESDLIITDMKISGSQSSQFAIVGGTTFTLKPGQSKDLSVTFTASETISNTADITIKSNSTTGDKVLPIIAKSCFERIDTTAFTFGKLSAGMQKIDTTLQICNTGSKSAEITGITVVGSDKFSLKNPPIFPLTLVSGECRTIVVSFNAEQSGTYTAGLQVISGKGTYTIPLSTEILSSVNDSEISGLIIMPNPTQSMISITGIMSAGIESISLISLMGREVFTQQGPFTHEKFDYSLNDVPSGVYMLRMQTRDGKHLMRQVIKQD